jgi:hypothetical protein
MQRRFGRLRRRREDNIKIDLKEIECEGVDWIYLAQNWSTLGSRVHSNETSCSIKDGKFLD